MKSRIIWTGVASVLLTVALSLTTYIANAAQTAGVITAQANTNQSALIRFTTAPTLCDSVYYCYDDTTFAALGDSTMGAKVITGLSPGVDYTFYAVTRNSGATVVSNKDTVTVYGPEIEEAPNTGVMSKNEKIVRAVSWRPVTVLETFTVNGASGADSSGVYNLWDENSLVLNFTQGGDSVNVMLYTWYGSREMTQTGETHGFVATQDSLNIDAPGTYGISLTPDTGAQCAYWAFGAYGDNGKNTAVEAWLNRRKY